MTTLLTLIVIIDDSAPDDDDGGYSLIDVSDKAIKSFKRASLDATIYYQLDYNYSKVATRALLHAYE